MKVKSHKKRIRALRALAVAGAVAALAAPSLAAATPRIDGWQTGVRHENGPQTQKPYSLPSGFHTEVQSASSSKYSLPSGFHTEVQSGSGPSTERPFALPAGFKPEIQSAPSTTAPSSSPATIVREIRTVTDDGGRTLALVLAAVALAIALCSTAYAAVRLTRMQRRVLGS
jgi:hypothetical protein